MFSRMHMALLLCLPATAFADTPVPSPSTAVARASELGRVQVTGTKPLVELLQQMKAAIDAPFTNDPRHYDDMVCRIENQEGFRAQGLVLDCGTQGYYSMRRAIIHRDMDLGEDVDTTGTPPLGHPWHIVRLLNHEQVAALRKVLGKLPEPGKGDIEVLDDSAPAAVTSTPAPAAATR